MPVQRRGALLVGLGGRQARQGHRVELSIPECPKIENLLSFYNERVDLYVDGVLRERPITPFT